MVATKLKPDLSSLALQSLQAADYSAKEIAGMIGKSVAFVHQIAAGQQPLNREQMRTIQMATGVSCHVWAVRALDRGGLSPRRKQMVDEAETVMSQWDRFVAGIETVQNGRPTNGAARPRKALRKRVA